MLDSKNSTEEEWVYAKNNNGTTVFACVKNNNILGYTYRKENGEWLVFCWDNRLKRYLQSIEPSREFAAQEIAKRALDDGERYDRR
jgi:hypothetical protein